MPKSQSSFLLRYQSYGSTQEFLTLQSLKMQAIRYFETSGINNPAIQRYNPQHPTSVFTHIREISTKTVQKVHMKSNLFTPTRFGPKADPAIVK
jgi:hypothetical protein